MRPGLNFGVGIVTRWEYYRLPMLIFLGIIVVILIVMLGCVLYYQVDAARNAYGEALSIQSVINQRWQLTVDEKDRRIEAMDADYKALVESYLRETGKVYVRPVQVENKLKAPEPSAFRMRPPNPTRVPAQDPTSRLHKETR